MWVQSGSQQEKGNQHSKLIHWYLVWLVPVKDLTIHFCFGFDRFALGKECLVHPALFAVVLDVALTINMPSFKVASQTDNGTQPGGYTGG